MEDKQAGMQEAIHLLKAVIRFLHQTVFVHCLYTESLHKAQSLWHKEDPGLPSLIASWCS